MIRITQTHIINLAISYLKQKDWKILYVDFPGGTRSGIGDIALINGIWERLYNLSPDILAVKGANLLLLEVDSTLQEIYLEKFLKYKSKRKELVFELNRLLGLNINEVVLGFVAKKGKPPHRIPDELHPFCYLGYDNNSNFNEIDF